MIALQKGYMVFRLKFIQRLHQVDGVEVEHAVVKVDGVAARAVVEHIIRLEVVVHQTVGMLFSEKLRQGVGYGGAF